MVKFLPSGFPTFMRMISEQTIDEVIQNLADADEDLFQQMADDQPLLAAYLAAEDHQAFTQEETQYLYYLALLCWLCFQRSYDTLDEIEEEALTMREEQNWNRIDMLRPAALKNIVDRWMPDYPEQELLFYLEDALQMDEEDPDHPVTKSGQIPLFVTLITIIDILSETAKSS